MLASKTKQQIDIFNTNLEERLYNTRLMVDGVAGFDSAYLDDIKYNQENQSVVLDRGITPTDDYYGDMITGERPETDDEEAVDKYLNFELILYVGSTNERRGRVAKSSRGIDVEAVGHAHANPFFDTREYYIQFTDGSLDKYTANVITENMFCTCG